MEFYNLKPERLILLQTLERTERGEIVKLARSIGKYGLLVPITAKRILHTDKFEIISGTKRFYACRLAGLKYIPTCVVDNLPSNVARLAAKRGEKQDIFDEAEALRTAMLSEGMTLEEISDGVGYTEKEIVGLMRLTKMGEFERETVRRNSISFETASEIACFDDICTRTELLSDVIHSRLKFTEVKALCEKRRKGNKIPDKAKANRSPKFRDMRLFDNTLARALTLLKDAGIKADIASQEVIGGKEYKIRIEN